MSTSVISASNLSKTYYQGLTRIDAVKGVTLTLEKGRMTAIVGPSGAGKSTLLHMLGGLDKPSLGTVLFNDRDIYRQNDRER
ncbi:MAG: ATP-binding cassette domain-containing protein, partial [Candidatus Omnitrophica bacterium]|nr:ATP-binding cassette domain-containing protein [Candidatus Omnitrophota bacterium]